MSEKINSLYNKILDKNKLNNIINKNNKLNIMNDNNNYNNEINMNKAYNNEKNNIDNNLNEIIKIKDKQIKDSLSLITYLTREKNKLKEELFNLKDQIEKDNKINNSAVINGKKKISLLKTTISQQFKLNSYNQSNQSNPNIEKNNENENDNVNENENENKPNNQDNDNDNENINNNVNNQENDLFQKRINYSSTIYKNMLLQNRNNMKNRALSSANILVSKKQLQDSVNIKMNKLFNEDERKALSTLFKSEEEFEYFNQKINVIHNHNSAIERKLLIKIRSLKKDNDDKDEQIQYLQNKCRECESKLRVLESKINYEKYVIKQMKKTSYNNQSTFLNSQTKKTNSIYKDGKNTSFLFSHRSIDN